MKSALFISSLFIFFYGACSSKPKTVENLIELSIEDQIAKIERELAVTTDAPTPVPTLAPVYEVEGTFSGLCIENATACFEDETCLTCVQLGSVVLDSNEAITCDDAWGMFFNAYNGSTSTDSDLECEPYNEASLLYDYLSCVWADTPCESSAMTVVVGALTVISGIIGVMLL